MVVTNNGTSDNLERIWRLPRRVVAVRALSATDCGADARVLVDTFNDKGLVVGKRTVTFRLCFLAADGELQATLSLSEVSR
jgi:hypothetical protein